MYLTSDSNSKTTTFPVKLTCIATVVLGNDEKFNRVAGGIDGSLFNFAADGADIPIHFARCRAHGRQITCLDWNPRMRRLASASRDGEVIVWDWTRQEVLRRLPHSQEVSSLAFSPDGGQLLTLTQGGVRCWDIAAGEELDRYPYQGNRRGLLWMPDGIAYFDGSAVAALDRSGLLPLEGEADFGLAALEGGAKLIGAVRNKGLVVWDAKTGNRTFQFGEKLSCAAYNPWRTRVILGDTEGNVTLWNVQTGQKIKDLAQMGSQVDAIAISPRADAGSAISGPTLRSFALDSEVIPHLKASLRISEGSTPGEHLVFSPDSFRVFIAGSQHVWRANLNSDFGGLSRVEGAAPAACIDVSPDGMRLLTARSNPDRSGLGPILLQLAAYHVDKNDPVLRRYRGHEGGTNAAYFIRNGSRIVSGGNDNHVRIWETATEEEIDHLDVGSAVSSLALSRDEGRVIVAGGGVDLEVWSLANKQRLGSLKGHSLAVNSLASARNADVAVSASGDRTTRVWDLATLQSLAVFEHTTPVTAAVITNDGQRVITGSRDGSIRTWDVSSKAAGPVIWAHQGAVTALDLAPDCRSVLSTGADLMVNWWDVPSVP